MNQPKLEDFNLSEDDLVLIGNTKKTNFSIQRIVYDIIYSLIFIIVFAIFFVIFINDKSFSGDIIGSLIVSAFVTLFVGGLIYVVLEEIKVLEKIAKLFYHNIPKQNELEKYENYKKEYSKYLEEINKQNARKIIDASLENLPKLKQKIFNKRIADDSYDNFLEFKDALLELKDLSRYMDWNEMQYYWDFERYLKSRERQLSESGERYEAKNYRKKERTEVFLKELLDMRENTDKITIDETKDVQNDSVERENEHQRTFEGKKIDFEEISRENSSLGLKGEKAIISYEKEILTRNGRSDLAKSVRHIAEDEGAGTGYDILSFDIGGNPKKIEVKTTKGGKRTPFMLSENEVAFMQSETENYYLYRLFDFDDEKGTGKLDITKGFKEVVAKYNLEPSQYKVKIK